MLSARDIRSLGPALPVRAAYELSKRVGGHALVFNKVLGTPTDAPELISPYPTPEAITGGARERTTAEAQRILAGSVLLFGREIHLGDELDWNSVIHRDGSWPSRPWWRIDVAGPGRPGDVKWAWELGRHRHLVILARAAHLEPDDERYLDLLGRHLDTWLLQAPPEMGVHWYSNLEIALRSLAWLEILTLVGDRLHPGLRSQMTSVLHHSGRHLFADIFHTALTMRNNHLLGDALGLVALGKAFPGDGKAATWKRLGDTLMVRHVERIFSSDGSCNEDSVSYHRFVVEMLSVRVLLGDAPSTIRGALSDACQFLARLGALEGPVPNYGDSDEGRAIVSTNTDPNAGAVALGLALTGTGANPEGRNDCDELAWYVGEGLPITPEPASVSGVNLGADIGRIGQGPFTVWLKAGSFESHGHSDLLSASILCNGQWVIGDPGTGTYNESPEERTFFRCSRAHNVVRIDGEDQRVPNRTFHWVYSPRGRMGAPIAIGEYVLTWGVHDAYQRLEHPSRVARVVMVSNHLVVVADWVDTPNTPYELSLSVHPNVEWRDRTLILDSGDKLSLSAPTAKPIPSWWSDAYGSRRETIQLSVEGVTGQPIVWGVGDDSAAAPQSAEGWVRVDDISVSISWTESGARLVATSGTTEEQANVTL
jgi:Heparinase II/III-like protein/Heparinase II/III N-terminus